MGNGLSRYDGANIMNSAGSHIKQTDEFIIKHLKNNKINDASLAIECLDDRRLVFVCLRGLYETWNCVPSILLHTSLLLIPLQQKWIDNPSKYADELREHLYVACGCTNSLEMREFIHLLRWKHSQRLVVWILDDIEVDEHIIKRNQMQINPLVAPFWYRVSEKLTTLYDHVQDSYYKPLRVQEKYWSKMCSKYNTKIEGILCELYFVTMKSRKMQEIIYQSNPKSLHPVIAYKSELRVAANGVYDDFVESSSVSPLALTPIIELVEEVAFYFNANCKSVTRN